MSVLALQLLVEAWERLPANCVRLKLGGVLLSSTRLLGSYNMPTEQTLTVSIADKLA